MPHAVVSRSQTPQTEQRPAAALPATRTEEPAPSRTVSGGVATMSQAAQPAMADDLPPWEMPPADAYLESMPEHSEAADQAVADSYAAPDPTISAQVPASTPVHPSMATSAGRGQPAAAPTMTVPPTVVATPTGQSDERWHSQDLLLGSGDPWSELIAASGVGGRLRQLALHACRQVEGDCWILTLPAEQRHLVSDKAIAALADGFSQHLGQPVQIQIVLDNPTDPTPAQIERQRYAQLLVQAQQDLTQDPHIQFLIQRFGAQLDADSILPLKH